MKFDLVELKLLLGPKGYLRGPFGSALKRAELKQSGIPVYEQQHAITGTRDFRYFIDEQKYESLQRFAIFANDLIISCSGTVGRVSVISKDDPRGIISQALLVLRPDTSKIIPLYLYYFLISSQGQRELLNASQGAVQQNIAPRAVVEKILVPTPSLDHQERIVTILKAIDDKIQLNLQTNQTLEQMAQAIFKSWFVDFEPVKAKIASLEASGSEEEAQLAAMQALSGKSEAELSRLQNEKPEEFAELYDTATLFPSAMQDSELGEIPESWDATTFGAVSNCLDKHRIPLSKAQREKKQGKIPYYGATSIMDYVDEPIFDGIYLLLGEDGSVLREDGTPFTQYIWGKSWINNHAHVLQGTDHVSTEQLLLFLKKQNITPYVTGAVQLKLNQKNMNSIPFVKAEFELCKAFEKLVSPIFAEIRNRHDESTTLTKVRNALLPRVFSGSIKLGDTA